MLLEGTLSLVSPISLWLRQGDLDPGEGRVIATLGDSVTFGFGLPREAAWPAALQRWLDARNLSYKVVNRAAGGSKVGHVVERDAPWLSHLPTTARPLVLLMVGHNDLLSWGGMGGGGTPPAPGRPTWEPRLYRLFRWALGIARDEVPHDRISDADVALFADQIRLLQQATASRGGTLILLTYLVPGSPPSDADPHWAEVLDATRRHQLAINDLLRTVATDLHLPLIDLARGLPVATTWDAEMFRDDIHLTAGGSQQVADAVARWLVVQGWLGRQEEVRGR